MREYSPPLDEGIRRYVEILNENGVETYESCEGGPGHSYHEPTVRFEGGYAAGFRALSVAIMFALPVSELRRAWSIDSITQEPVGPHWELTFHKLADEWFGRIEKREAAYEAQRANRRTTCPER